MYSNYCQPANKRAQSGFPSIWNNFFQEENLGNYFQGQSPATNIKESATGFTLEISAPGLQKEDFHLNIEHELLTISAEKNQTTEQSTEKYSMREFAIASFKRSFRLGKTIDSENVQASYTNGILHIHLPKKEESQAKPARTVAVA